MTPEEMALRIEALETALEELGDVIHEAARKLHPQDQAEALLRGLEFWANGCPEPEGPMRTNEVRDE